MEWYVHVKLGACAMSYDRSNSQVIYLHFTQWPLAFRYDGKKAHLRRQITFRMLHWTISFSSVLIEAVINNVGNANSLIISTDRNTHARTSTKNRYWLDSFVLFLFIVHNQFQFWNMQLTLSWNWNWTWFIEDSYIQLLVLWDNGM